MDKYDRSTHMKSIHAKRKANTYHKVDEAIKRLVRVNERINFNSVANEADVAKATLYNNVKIRERIETLRQQQSQAVTSKQNEKLMRVTRMPLLNHLNEKSKK